MVSDSTATEEMRMPRVSILSFVLMALVQVSPYLEFDVKQIGEPTCNAPLTVRIPLQVDIRNVSSKPAVVGQVDVLHERFYRLTSRDDKGALDLIRTSPTPDTFESADAALSKIKEQLLSPHTKMVLTFKHPVFLSSRDINLDGATRKLVVSFHITNLEKSGNASDSWSEPVIIDLPSNCKLSLR
jgi:hypothetical protein